MGPLKFWPRRKKMMIYIDVLVNGRLKARYTLEASKVRSMSTNLGPPAEAHGHNAKFTIDIPVEIS